jgi:hypothetical protein
VIRPTARNSRSACEATRLATPKGLTVLTDCWRNGCWVDLWCIVEGTLDPFCKLRRSAEPQNACVGPDSSPRKVVLPALSKPMMRTENCRKERSRVETAVPRSNGPSAAGFLPSPTALQHLDDALSKLLTSSFCVTWLMKPEIRRYTV